MEVVASLSQGRTAAAQCGLFTHKSVPVIFEPPCTWYTILDSINQELEKKYKTIEMKLQALQRSQIKQHENTNRFYTHLINKIDIRFTCYKLTFLNEGLKYNLNHKQKHRIKSLALEAEAVITQLPTHEQDHIQ